jgi:uncharacterized sodium:solute symporter family permease YidK
MKKPVLIVVGILLALVGVFWTLQGAGVFQQSGGMNGKHAFIVIGIVVAVIGLVLIAAGARTRGGTPTN